MITSLKSKTWRLYVVFATAFVAVFLSWVAVSPARAETTYDIEKNQALYGNLNQNNIPGGGAYLCGPTAATNSFVYLENAYAATYGRSLVPDTNPNNGQYDQNELIAVANTLAGAVYMNSQLNLVGGGGASGTYDDMFIYGKMTYIEAQKPGVTTYAAQMASIWGWPSGDPLNPRVAPPIAKPLWVQDNTTPTWQFLYNKLTACGDVEILITDEPVWGHFLTVTGFTWTDSDDDNIVEASEGAALFYIDPATGAAGVSPISQQVLDGQLYVNYGAYPNAQLVMTVSEIPEPATLSLLALGGLALLKRRRR